MAARIIALLLLVAILAFLQMRLWSGDASLTALHEKQARLTDLQATHESLAERNRRLFAEVDDLKTGLGALEARARVDLGLIGPDETFFQVIEDARTDQITPPRGDANTLPSTPPVPVAAPAASAANKAPSTASTGR